MELLIQVQGEESASGLTSDLPEANIIHTNDVHGRIVEEKELLETLN